MIKLTDFVPNFVFAGCRKDPGRVGGLPVSRGRHQEDEARHGTRGRRRERRRSRDAVG